MPRTCVAESMLSPSIPEPMMSPVTGIGIGIRTGLGLGNLRGPTLPHHLPWRNTATRSTSFVQELASSPQSYPRGAAMSAGNQKIASQTYICGSAAVIGTQTHDECKTELSLERKYNLSSGVWQWNAITTTTVSTTSRSLGWSRIVCTEQRLHQLPEARR